MKGGLFYLRNLSVIHASEHSVVFCYKIHVWVVFLINLLGLFSLFTECLPVCLCVPYAHFRADVHRDQKTLSVPLDLEL